MFVCVCRAVQEREVVDVIRSGADSLEKVESACGAGGDCGACRGMIHDLIEDHCCSRRHLRVVDDGDGDGDEERAA